MVRPWRPRAEGIYRHRIGEGESLLHTDRALTVRWARCDRPLPKQQLVVVGRLCPNETQCALNADDGSLAPLALHAWTPLHRAACANNLAATRSALAAGGGVDAETDWGFTALQMAVKRRHDDIALQLAQGPTRATGNARSFRPCSWRCTCNAGRCWTRWAAPWPTRTCCCTPSPAPGDSGSGSPTTRGRTGAKPCRTCCS